MKTSISLNDMPFYAYHGVLEQERTVGNRFTVSVTIDYPFERAMQTDELDGTLNYAELYALVQREMKTPSKLLEHVAGRIINAIRREFPEVTGGRITITKQKPPIPGSVSPSAVTVEW